MPIKTSRLPLVNAQAMHQRNPDTFEVPTPDELAKVRKGDSVKICAGRERFWCTVLAVSDTIITASVDNDLVLTHDHGLKYRDHIQFERKNVYGIFTKYNPEEH